MPRKHGESDSSGGQCPERPARVGSAGRERLRAGCILHSAQEDPEGPVGSRPCPEEVPGAPNSNATPSTRVPDGLEMPYSEQNPRQFRPEAVPWQTPGGDHMGQFRHRETVDKSLPKQRPKCLSGHPSAKACRLWALLCCRGAAARRERRGHHSRSGQGAAMRRGPGGWEQTAHRDTSLSPATSRPSKRSGQGGGLGAGQPGDDAWEGPETT